MYCVSCLLFLWESSEEAGFKELTQGLKTDLFSEAKLEIKKQFVEW